MRKSVFNTDIMKKATWNPEDWTLTIIWKNKKPERDTAKQFRRSQLNVKLLKSIISKFEGTNLDWLKFWSHFEREIDLADIKTGSNFS